MVGCHSGRRPFVWVEILFVEVSRAANRSYTNNSLFERKGARPDNFLSDLPSVRSGRLMKVWLFLRTINSVVDGMSMKDPGFRTCIH